MTGTMTTVVVLVATIGRSKGDATTTVASAAASTSSTSAGYSGTSGVS